MNITVQLEIDKNEFKTFEESEEFCYETGLRIAREMMAKFLEINDLMILSERDSTRYRNKGFRKTCLKTLMGEVEYSRRVYEDLESGDGPRFVHLLDEKLEIEKVGLVSANLCRKAVEVVCESSYRVSSRQISASTGQHLSHQEVWSITQAIGEKQIHLLERKSKLASNGAGRGKIKTSILYEESDGIWLKLQGNSREKYGPSREMKLGIAYDGVTKQPCKGGDYRRILDNKVALAGYMEAEEFKKRKEGVIADRYDVSSISLRVVNGDGAQWIQKGEDENKICVLDAYHRNRKITECVSDPEFAAMLRNLLYEKKTDLAIECIKAQMNSLEDTGEIEKLQELYSYYNNNREALPGYYDRGIDIPETRDPGVVHHARLGSMESNVFTLIGNRMKDGRAVWSINGANNLAVLLCAYHTGGLENLFPALPNTPEIKQQEPECNNRKPLSASKMPASEGHGNEYVKNISTTNCPYFLRDISSFSALSNLSFC